MNILLIGCGRTGRAVAGKLLEFKCIDKFYLYSRTSKSAESLAYDLANRKIVVVENIKNLKDKDISHVIIAISGMSDSAREESMTVRGTTYQVRQDEFKFNIGAIMHLIEDLKNFPKKTTIIVITNPVDEITNYMRVMLKRENVIGFGLELDAKRYERVLGKKIYCMGTHGKAIPLIDKPTDKDYDSLHEQVDLALLTYIREHGIPHAMAGIYFKEFFEKFNSETTEVVHISYYLKNSFLGIKDVSVSLPWQVKSGIVLEPLDLSVNEIEKKRFVESVTELKKSITTILATHKKLLGYK